MAELTITDGTLVLHLSTAEHLEGFHGDIVVPLAAITAVRVAADPWTELRGPQAGLDALASIPQRERLESHYLLHAVAGELHWRLKDDHAAAASFRRALQLARVGPEQLYLTRMLERSSDPSGASPAVSQRAD